MSADGIKLLKTPVLDKSKWMQLPRDVVIGHDVIEQIPKVCEDLGLSGPVLVISGAGRTMKVAGERVLSLLEDQYETDCFLVDAINPETIEKAEKAYKPTCRDV